MGNVIYSHLFVGGPWDGRRQVMREQQDVLITERLEHPDPAFFTVRHTRYSRVLMAAGGATYAVWASEGLSPDDVLIRLLTHYTPPDAGP